MLGFGPISSDPVSALPRLAVFIDAAGSFYVRLTPPVEFLTGDPTKRLVYVVEINVQPITGEDTPVLGDEIVRTLIVDHTHVATGVAAALGVGAGHGIVARTDAVIAAAAGVGIGSVVGFTSGITVASGSAAGVGAASAVGRKTAAAVGTASGTGAASAVGSAEDILRAVVTWVEFETSSP